MIDVRMPPTAAAEDAALVNELSALVSSVYAVAEEGLWADGTSRTTPETMAELIAAGQIAVARGDERIVGAVRVQRLDTGEGEFGMLVADPAHRGQGVGRGRFGSPSAGVASEASTRCSSRSWCRGSGRIRAGGPDSLVRPHRLPPGAYRAVREDLSRARAAPRDTLRLRHLSQEFVGLGRPLRNATRSRSTDGQRAAL